MSRKISWFESLVYNFLVETTIVYSFFSSSYSNSLEELLLLESSLEDPISSSDSSEDSNRGLFGD
jgi:hypothetical protein